MKVLQSVQIFKIGKWLEISVLGCPGVKKVIFSPWSVRMYVCVYYRFKWEKVV
jgi:hypothetical protein